MRISEIFTLLGGVALFLFGMELMGDGLKKLSGSRIEPILYRLSGTTAKAVLFGAGLTAVIQSSCATAVMAVGFANSGMMKLRQSIGIILGAILGTSITAWIVCLSYLENAGGMTELLSAATLNGLISVIGIALLLFAKAQSARDLGSILMGFSVLSFGLSAMSGAVGGLGEREWFRAALTGLSHPLAGILVGAAFTALLQSASAAVGILQALSVSGAMTLETALPLLMGISFGASVPVLLSAVGANTAGRRTALVYPLATGIGTVVCAVCICLITALREPFFLSEIVDPVSLALVNTLLRLAMVLVLLPFSGLIEKAVVALAPEREKSAGAPTLRLEERFIAHPALALEQSRLTIHQMAERSETALRSSLSLFSVYSEEGFSGVRDLENAVDVYEDSLGTYLIRLTGRELTDGQSEQVSEYLHTLSDFERISDHALNLAESAKELTEKNVSFSAGAGCELEVLFAAVRQVVSMTITAFRERDLLAAARVEALEERIDELCDQMKLNHVERLQRGVCTIRQGFVFNDILTNCERVSDHCSNIAVAMIELSASEFQTHEYLRSLRSKDSPAFREALVEYRGRFSLNA